MLLLIEALDRLIGHGAADDGFDQHVAEDAFVHGLEPALGGGVLVQAATSGFGGQKLLVDHLVQNAAEQFGLDVQRLAFADQTLGHRLAAHVGGPDRTILHAGDDQVILFGRRFRTAAPAGGRQRQRRQHRGQQRQDGSEGGTRNSHQALRAGAENRTENRGWRPVAASP
ncbi:hypothetical protein D3C86_1714370 [compost metagenome]